MLYTKNQYKIDPFPFEDGIKLKHVSIPKAKKDYTCFGLTGKQDHKIFANCFYRYETALIDKKWKNYQMCLQCIEKHIEGNI